MYSATGVLADSLECSSDQGGSESSHDHPEFITYEEGAMLTLRAHALDNRLVTVRILKLYRPFSYSCVMKVEILHGLCKKDSVAERAILKLFDRRFAAKLRSEHNTSPWSPEIEEKYTDSVRAGSATNFLARSQQLSTDSDSVVDWSEAQKETYLQGVCSDALANEMKNYQVLKEMQGKSIPQVYSAVTIIPRGSIAASKQAIPLLQVRGFLMEHVVGPTLAHMRDFVPQRCWQGLIEETLKLVREMHKSGVMSEEVKPTHIIVRPTYEHDVQHKVLMVDLAQCVVRQKHQSDEDWTRLKTELDQEGAIFRTMSISLRKVGFDLQPVILN